ncbi:DapH/DapD/GlmU-related protein [Enterococcus faecium]|uniref:serine O-acetyltransferase n=1 Tax=Enterococcus sp. DIV0673 TaxID=2774930 RepID=UPI000DE8AB74
MYQIKKMDAFHNASLGTHIGFSSAKFEERPYLPHGLNGIIVSNDAIIGRQCQLYHQVTIGGGNGGSPVIGDNVLIGAGAKIIGPVKIGNNVKIGAGCVVTIDVPDNATVVMDKPRIILNRD